MRKKNVITPKINQITQVMLSYQIAHSIHMPLGAFNISEKKNV
jgi:hypothetical protein